MENLADIASAIQGESHTEETIKWAQQLHDVETHFTDELHARELNADTRRATELRDLENKLLARKLQIELDIGRRDATRDSVLLRASSVGNLLVTLSVMMGCAFMFVYQIQIPAKLPADPKDNNFTFSVKNVDGVRDENLSSLVPLNFSRLMMMRQNNISSSFFSQPYADLQSEFYTSHIQYAKKYGGGQLSILLLTILLWTAIGVLASAVWVGLILQLRIKKFKVHLPLFVYDCGHIHGVFGSYYSCQCLRLEVAMRRLFIYGTILIVLVSCVSSYEISVVSFASLGAALCFLVPVLVAVLVIIFGNWFVSEETAMVVETKRRTTRNRTSSTNETHNASQHHEQKMNKIAKMKKEEPQIKVTSPSNHHDDTGCDNSPDGEHQRQHSKHRGHLGAAMEPIDGNATNAASSPSSRLPSPLMMKRRRGEVKTKEK